MKTMINKHLGVFPKWHCFHMRYRMMAIVILRSLTLQSNKLVIRPTNHETHLMHNGLNPIHRP